jgi:hypothetical protein
MASRESEEERITKEAAADFDSWLENLDIIVTRELVFGNKDSTDMDDRAQHFYQELVSLRSEHAKVQAAMVKFSRLLNAAIRKRSL